MKHALAAILAAVSVPALAAQDTEYLRALERAQAPRPAALSSTARIAAESEPGTPLTIRGKLFAEDGKTAVADAIVFAYHTDRQGLYDKAGSPAHSWRIRGWAKTAADGAFEFRTIRPGRYPGDQSVTTSCNSLIPSNPSSPICRPATWSSWWTMRIGRMKGI